MIIAKNEIRFGPGSANPWTSASPTQVGCLTQQIGGAPNAGVDAFIRTTLGVFLGWFDLRPTEPSPFPEAARAAGVIPVKSGRLALRVRMGNSLGPTHGSDRVRNTMSAIAGHAICPLYLVGLDAALPAPTPINGAVDAYDPSISLVDGPAAALVQELGIGTPADNQPFRDAFAALARPVLDVIPYACGAQVWAAFDLGRLAGGTRYVGAWLRPMSLSVNGSDGLAGVQSRLYYTLDDRPAPALRDWRWSMPVISPDAQASGVPVRSAYGFAVAPPFALGSLYAGFSIDSGDDVSATITEDFGGIYGRWVDLAPGGDSSMLVISKVADDVAWPIGFRLTAPPGAAPAVGVIHLWGRGSGDAVASDDTGLTA